MKIYQLHKYSGVYEDYRDRIIGSYLLQKRAQEEKIKAETREQELIKHDKKCRKCPFLEEDFKNIDNLIAKYSNYCNEAKLEDGRDYGIYCANYYTHFDEATFAIKEVEVEE